MIGIESVEASIKDAKQNASDNQLTNCKFVEGTNPTTLPLGSIFFGQGGPARSASAKKVKSGGDQFRDHKSTYHGTLTRL